MTEPCASCGTRQEEWYDFTAPLPHGGFRRIEPPPYEAVALLDPGCQAVAHMVNELTDGGKREVEAGVKVVLRRWDPMASTAVEDEDE